MSDSMDVNEIPDPSEESMAGEPAWTPIDMPMSSSGGSSFVEGEPDGRRLRIRQYVRESDRRLFARIWFGPDAEGPPRHAHGGSMAAVLDHTMGVGAWVAGYPVVAATITINFHRKLPLGLVALAETWVDRVDGRKVHTVGRLYHEDVEAPFATGTGIFIVQNLDSFKGLLGGDAVLESNMRKTLSNMPKR